MPELDTEDFKQWFEKSTVRNDAGELLSIKNPKALDSYDQMQAFQNNEIPRYAALGYDGFVGEGADGIHYVTFSPTQIKNAEGIDAALAATKHMEPLDPDWGKGSKVVGDDGELLTVFHGTKGNFTQFNAPAWFTPDHKMADFFSEAPGEDGQERTPDSKIIAVQLDIKNPLLTDDWSVTGSLASQGKWRDAQIMAGYDGVKFVSEEGEVEYIAFHPHQIRVVEGFEKKAAADKALEFLHTLAPPATSKARP